MKKFNFSLQKVLEYNTHIQKKEKDILSKMRAEYNDLEQQLHLIQVRYEYEKQNYISVCQKGTSIKNATLILNYIKDLQNQIRLQKKKMIEKQIQIDAQTEKLIEVSKDKTTVEKLRESKYQKYKFEERKSEERFIEEFIANTASKAV